VLIEHGHEIAIVISNPDRRRGRRGELEPSPVKRVAIANNIRVAESPAAVLEANCDLGIVVAYGRLIRPNVLEYVSMVNVHFSLLPRWRGAAPVERAILAGDMETGVCIMGLEAGLDTGPVFARVATPIDPGEHADALRARLGGLGSQLLLNQLGLGKRAWIDPKPQIGEATYAEKITVEDLHLDFGESALVGQRRIRVGRAWTTFRGKRFLIHEAQVIDDTPEGAIGEIVGDLVVTGEGALRLVRVQSEGKAQMDVATWRAGARPGTGESLG
jgi:methionyl-tRNA formyltransferase